MTSRPPEPGHRAQIRAAIGSSSTNSCDAIGGRITAIMGNTSAVGEVASLDSNVFADDRSATRNWAIRAARVPVEHLSRRPFAPSAMICRQHFSEHSLDPNLASDRLRGPLVITTDHRDVQAQCL